MKRFFDCIAAIHQFTQNLDIHKDSLANSGCCENGQFVSHGFIYKQRSSVDPEPVGKRIFCSNRYGAKGCGRTFQLYVSTEIPYFRYGATHWLTFTSALLANMSVTEAYRKAIGDKDEYRNAWRWMDKLMAQLSVFRCHLDRRHPPSDSSTLTPRSQRSRILLPTLQHLFGLFEDCSGYQLKQQRAFI